ncbi:hypothetical protein LIHA111178_07965 [Litorimonas haliclonae]
MLSRKVVKYAAESLTLVFAMGVMAAWVILLGVFTGAL